MDKDGKAASEAARQLAEAVGQRMYEADAAVHELGIALDGIGPGHARMSLRVTERMTNSHGICHGGVIFSLADACFAYACNAYNTVAVAAGCDIAYTAPAKVGDLLAAVAEEKHLHGRNGVYDVTVTNQDGTVIAMFRGHSRRLKARVIPELQSEPNDA